MEYIILLIAVLVVLVTLHYIFFTKVSIIKKIGANEKINKITDKLPSNIEVCKKILRMIGNSRTKIEEDKNADASLYLVMSDKIIISNVKNNYTRIQTIAHECIHSMQEKKILWFNFIFSNLYLLYFLIATVLAIFKVGGNPLIHAFLLMMFGFLQYAVRSYLEADAMIKARYLAFNYMISEKLLTKEEINEVVGNYDILNKVGVKYVNYDTAIRFLIKLAIYLVVVCIVGMV